MTERRTGGTGVTKRLSLIAKQSSKPSGLLGRLIGNIMAMETSLENSATLDLLELRQGDRVLEIGFGHGKTIKRAASRYSGGLIAGVDQSELMVHMASRRNRDLIKVGRVELKLGDATTLPFADESFDKAFSVHTIYFWANPSQSLER
jgi:ubiquinone/menaquinone biosynthesis C-methylase UbiE